jgi:hypothetical protein
VNAETAAREEALAMNEQKIGNRKLSMAGKRRGSTMSRSSLQRLYSSNTAVNRAPPNNNSNSNHASQSYRSNTVKQAESNAVSAVASTPTPGDDFQLYEPSILYTANGPAVRSGSRLRNISRDDIGKIVAELPAVYIAFVLLLTCATFSRMDYPLGIYTLKLSPLINFLNAPVFVDSYDAYNFVPISLPVYFSSL